MILLRRKEKNKGPCGYDFGLRSTNSKVCSQLWHLLPAGRLLRFCIPHHPFLEEWKVITATILPFYSNAMQIKLIPGCSVHHRKI